TEGSELRVAGTRGPALTVTALLGLGRCEARGAAAAHVRSGTLLELSGWAVPPPRALRVAIPRADIGGATFARPAAAIRKAIADPTTRTPDHVLRRSGARWELIDEHPGSFASDDEALRALARLRGSAFVQLPATTALAAQLAGIGAIDVVACVEEADYVLVGR